MSARTWKRMGRSLELLANDGAYALLIREGMDKFVEYLNALEARYAEALQVASELAAELALIRWEITGPIGDSRHCCRGCGHEEDEACADFCRVDASLKDFRKLGGQKGEGHEGI